MKKSVFSPFLSALSLVALPLAMTDVANAQGAAKPRTIYLYNASLGTAPASINAAKSGPWGNGSITKARRVDYEGAPVVQIQTRNLQEGVRFDFTTPVDIDAYRDAGFLRLRLRFRDAGGSQGGFRGGGSRGGGSSSSGSSSSGSTGGGGDFMRGGGFRGGDRGGGGEGQNFLMRPRWSGNAQFDGALPPFGGGSRGGGFPGAGSRGDGSRGGFPGGTGEEGQGFEGTGVPVAPPQTTPIKEIAVTLLRENGATAGRILVDLKTQTPDEQGWRLFVLPIKGMTSTPGASGRVTRAIFTSDADDTFYMAQAALVIESGEMTVSIRRPEDVAGAGAAEVEIKPGPISLIADVEAGAADPIVEWNFDADNVGNLPPGALSTPPDTFGGGGETSTGEGGAFPGSTGGSRFPGATPGQRGTGGAGTGQRSTGGGGTGQRGTGERGTGQGGTGQRGTGQRGNGQGGTVGQGGSTGQGGFVETGPRLDARGLTATFEYPNEEQNYRVEVTVRDRTGVKAPVTASILVKVRG